MTSPAHQSGTDRIAEVAAKVPADIYLNVQGDLPFIDPADLDALAAPMRADGGYRDGHAGDADRSMPTSGTIPTW